MPGRPREADPRVEYFTVMRRPDHVTDARAEQSKSAQNKESGTEITHYRRPRPKPVDPTAAPAGSARLENGLELKVYFETGLAFRVDRRHGIASAHFMCPSKPSEVAMAR
jgi:hypothetical protein